MSKLPSNLRWEDIANVLRRLGYTLARKRGSHALFVNEEGRMVVVVMKSPVKRGALEAIIDQTGVSREKFLELL